MKYILKYEAALGAIIVLLFIVNCFLFYPGYYSNDSMQQLSQMLGKSPLSDWHPPVMALVWKALFVITGKKSAMLVSQLFLFWTAMGLLSVAIYHRTRNKLVSLAPVALGLLPMTIGISGVIWKDVQMAYALVLAVVLILLPPTFEKLRNNRKWKWAIASAAIVLILYAGLLRYNALIAVIPLLFLGVDSLGIIKGWKIKLLVATALIILATGVSMTSNKIIGVAKANPASAILLDDIVNIRDQEEISGHRTELYQAIAAIKRSCQAHGVVINSYWTCTDEHERSVISQSQYKELKRYWLSTVVTNPFEYALYRTETFMLFVFAPDQYIFLYNQGVVPNDLGIKVRSSKAQTILNVYVMEFGYRHFSYIFQAWFWIIAGFITLWIGIKRTKVYRKEVVALSLSSLIYIFSYIPVVVATDYRYIYWSVFATLLAALLIVTEGRRVISVQKNNTNAESRVSHR